MDICISFTSIIVVKSYNKYLWSYSLRFMFEYWQWKHCYCNSWDKGYFSVLMDHHFSIYNSYIVSMFHRVSHSPQLPTLMFNTYSIFSQLGSCKCSHNLWFSMSLIMKVTFCIIMDTLAFCILYYYWHTKYYIKWF